MRGWFRKVWNVRGGGLYAVGYIVSFLWFEITSVGADIVDFFRINEYLSGELLAFVIGIVVDSFKNMVYAFMWPVYIIQWNAVVGGILLGGAFALFPTFVKPHIERYLFDGEEQEEMKGEVK